MGPYYVVGKPSDFSASLRPTIFALAALLTKGMKVSNVSVTVCLASVVCDTAGSAFIRQVNAPIGYYGCDKCIQRGQHYHNGSNTPM